MNDFPDIETVGIMLDKIAESMPKEFYEELNGGISLSPMSMLHPDSLPNHPIYIMGQYRRSIIGNSIEIFYGSFKEVYKNISSDELYVKLRYVLSHEFRHHMEMRAGVSDLILWDEREMEKIKEERWQR